MLQSSPPPLLSPPTKPILGHPKPNWLHTVISSSKPRKSNDLHTVTWRASGLELLLLESMVDSISSALALCVVGKFFSFQPMVDMVRKWCLARWKLTSLVTVSVMEDALFLFSFTNKEVRLSVLAGSWYYGKNLLLTTKWKPDFFPTMNFSDVCLAPWASIGILG